ncbi:hypothetical protein [Vallicoccus soli]|uniref:Uncharacterized protein n=1 Tax=Vallicoccus soli TaxID=2339232 RepID=A0A3A3YVZ3_9ACTN|nr:hypothetical protein [Vallicoccus soli]RJK94857.1 hypothetical protein D5H78_13710 [Vallicoccus soli]
MTSSRRSLLVLGAVLVAGAALAPPAVASCAGEVTLVGLAGAPEALLVRVEEQRGPRARVTVQQVWSGPDRPPEVWVVTGETERGVSSSLDVELVVGRLYVLAVHGDALRTSACTALAVTLDEARAAAPAAARAPVPGSRGAAPPPLSPLAVLGLAGGGAAAAVGLGALLVQAWRRRPVR